MGKHVAQGFFSSEIHIIDKSQEDRVFSLICLIVGLDNDLVIRYLDKTR